MHLLKGRYRKYHANRQNCNFVIFRDAHRDDSTSCTTRSLSVSPAHRLFYLLKHEALTPTAGTIQRVNAIRTLSSTRQSYNRWKRFNVSAVSVGSFLFPQLRAWFARDNAIRSTMWRMHEMSLRGNRIGGIATLVRPLERISGSRDPTWPVIARGWKIPPSRVFCRWRKAIAAIWFLLAMGREYRRRVPLRIRILEFLSPFQRLLLQPSRVIILIARLDLVLVAE